VGWFYPVKMKGTPFYKEREGVAQEKRYPFLKIISRAGGPISIELKTNHPWVKGIHVCTLKDQVLFIGG
jgi:hypothetical protein